MTVRVRRRARRGSITVLAAITLYVVVLLGVVAWSGTQEWADHALIARLLGSAAYDASHRMADGGLLAGAPALVCLDPSCAPQTCPAALARDPEGTTAEGEGCRAFQQGLARTYPGAHARVDAAAVLAATRVRVLAPGAHDPDDTARVYHYPTVCLSTDATIGVLDHAGLGFRQHFHACAQAVYR